MFVIENTHKKRVKSNFETTKYKKGLRWKLGLVAQAPSMDSCQNSNERVQQLAWQQWKLKKAELHSENVRCINYRENSVKGGRERKITVTVSNLFTRGAVTRDALL